MRLNAVSLSKSPAGLEALIMARNHARKMAFESAGFERRNLQHHCRQKPAYKPV
jgi:hypothetical protein